MSQEDDNLERKSRVVELIEKLSERVEANHEEAQSRAEETQRNMDFVIRQQAQFASDIQRQQERFASDIQTVNGLLNRLANVTLTRFEKVEDDVSNLETKMAALVDSHIRLTDAQTQTDERLGAFITTVERLISERHNGGGRAAEGDGPQGEGQR